MAVSLMLHTPSNPASPNSNNSASPASQPPPTPLSPTDPYQSSQQQQPATPTASNGSRPSTADAKPGTSTGAAPNEKRKTSRRANTAERRATHNAVERQRRETLNGRFLDLAALLPNLSSVRRPSKSAIVNSSIALIHAQRRSRATAARELRTLYQQFHHMKAECDEWRARMNIPPVEEPDKSADFIALLECREEEEMGEEERGALRMAANANARDGEEMEEGDDAEAGAEDQQEANVAAANAISGNGAPTTQPTPAQIAQHQQHLAQVHAQAQAAQQQVQQAQQMAHVNASYHAQMRARAATFSHGHGHPLSHPHHSHSHVHGGHTLPPQQQQQHPHHLSQQSPFAHSVPNVMHVQHHSHLNGAPPSQHLHHQHTTDQLLPPFDSGSEIYSEPHLSSDTLASMGLVPLAGGGSGISGMGMGMLTSNPSLNGLDANYYHGMGIGIQLKSEWPSTPPLTSTGGITFANTTSAPGSNGAFDDSASSHSSGGSDTLSLSPGSNRNSPLGGGRSRAGSLNMPPMSVGLSAPGGGGGRTTTPVVVGGGGGGGGNQVMSMFF